MKTRIALNGNDGKWRIGIGERSRFERYSDVNWDELDQFLAANKGNTLFSALSYELRKAIFTTTKLQQPERFPLVLFWVPESVYIVENDQLILAEGTDNPENERLAQECLTSDNKRMKTVIWKARQSKADYLQQVRFLKEQIQQGNCYEVNYCQEFYGEAVELHSMTDCFHALNERTTAPFSLLLENENWMIASASPERFMQKRGTRLLSQPIKGTAPRGITEAEDQLRKTELLNSPKERSENVMIVDLVRNDLSRIAQKGSVRVDELFGIYTFPTVHQMISSVSCELKDNLPFSEILKALFPMGSMTGAPKVAAMQLAEQTERFTRGIYSGAIGYIEPNGDFDFNVMIRSLVYNRLGKTISCGVGGAITILSDPEAEYEECRTKVGKILETIGVCPW